MENVQTTTKSESKENNELVVVEQKEIAKREANKKHRAKINNAALDAIGKLLLEQFDMEFEKESKLIVQAIAVGKIPNVTINY